ncbi:MAG: NADH-quinone oxidoreductase subunit H [Pirellulaceae bacterium]|jgi:NADH-quinone oxidoreductase subunit H|nr:hydroxyacid dehydrogenase [Planctomycetaceae bacterium]MDB4864331.1 NADH-quinone oxidoreductase subunit H [Pirellulaceae bacterium]
MADFVNHILTLEDSWIGYIVAALVAAVLILHVVAVGALLFIWMERKISGRIQDRLGPTRVGGKFGWLQTLADGIKLIAKEDVTPDLADKFLFKIAPYVGLAASYAAFIALPFADGVVGQHVNTAVFFVLAVLGLEVFSVILAGYSSGSKWSLFGAMREAAQVVSYEVPLGMCVVVPVMICGTMNLTTIANMQAGFFTNWLVFNDPFTFLTAIVYFTCATAGVNRAPFDLAEAESELVAGFHTEYSGLRWSLFFMAEYSSMFIVAALASILFFGGSHGPIPIADVLGLLSLDNLGSSDPAFHVFNEDGGGFFASLNLEIAIARFLGVANLLLKGTIGVTVMMWVRWSFPRLRIDQVMTMCLKYCVPLAAVGFLGATAWQALDLPTGNSLMNSPRYSHHELWTADDSESTVEEASSNEVQTPHEDDTHAAAKAVELKTVPVSVVKGGER